MTNTVSQFGEGELVNSPKIVSYPHGKEIKWHHSQIPGALNKCERKHLKFGKFLKSNGLGKDFLNKITIYKGKQWSIQLPLDE